MRPDDLDSTVDSLRGKTDDLAAASPAMAGLTLRSSHNTGIGFGLTGTATPGIAGLPLECASRENLDLIQVERALNLAAPCRVLHGPNYAARPGHPPTHAGSQRDAS